MPSPGVDGGNAYPSSMASRDVVIASSCGMYSTHAPFGTAAVSDTCNSIRKCGHTATLNDSARCATLSHGVMPPMRAQSTWTIEQAPRSRYSRKCDAWYSDSPTAIGIVAAAASSTCPPRSSAGSGSSSHASISGANACARRRAHAFAPLMLAWLEEPLPAEDLGGHVELAAAATMPIAVGESLYHASHFREYLERGACSIVQVDCARIGGITPWLKVAHLAESFNVAVCPHFLMELHVSLTAAVPNGAWVEYIPQLDAITTSRLAMDDGYALPPSTPGLGIEWDHAAIDRAAISRATVSK